MTERPRTYMANDARRLQLLELGLQLFGSRSYNDVSIDDIATEAGISRGLMYHYFGSKRGFYLEVVRYASELLLESLEPTMHGSSEGAIRNGLRTFFSFAQSHAGAYRAMLKGGLGFDDAVHELVEETRARLLDRFLASAPFIPDTPYVRAFGRAWLGSVEKCVLSILEGNNTVSIDEHIHHLGLTLVMQVTLMTINQGNPPQESWGESLQKVAELFPMMVQLGQSGESP